MVDGAVGCRYGSCALLGELPDDDETDIDILVVVPSAVSRGAHFFGPEHSNEGGDSQSSGSSSRVREEEEEEEEERCGAGGGGGGAQRSGQRGGVTATTAGTSAAAAAQEEKCVLTALLRKDARVSALMAVTDAFVPCLRFRFEGVHVDLTLATPGLASLPGGAAQATGRGWEW